ncbi:MAG: hypothetical protein ACOH5I_17345 [Oligoflexus sp.]
MRILLCFLTFSTITACITVRNETPKGRSVGILSKHPDSKRCEEIASVDFEGGSWNSYSEAKQDLKEQAADYGATHIVLDVMERSGEHGRISASGTAYVGD